MKSPHYTRAVYLNEDSTFLSSLAATYSIAIFALMKIEKLIELVSYVNPDLIGSLHGRQAIKGISIRVPSGW
jgi:hypothetical protein